jgi:hypothetical protein
MIRATVLFVMIYLALIAQEYLPALGFLHGAHLLIVPVLFCCGALAFSFPAMIGLAVFTGLLSDLAYLSAIDDHVEIGLGWSILFYVFAGTVLHTLRSLFPAARWEVHCLSSGAVTLFLTSIQYSMVCLRRGSFYLDTAVFWHIAGPALLAIFIAPPVWFIFNLLPAASTSPEPRGSGGLRK